MFFLQSACARLNEVDKYRWIAIVQTSVVYVKQEKLILRKSMVKFDIEWKLTAYPMWVKMTWMINMCDKLFFFFFDNIFQGINEEI